MAGTGAGPVIRNRDQSGHTNRNNAQSCQSQARNVFVGSISTSGGGGGGRIDSMVKKLTVFGAGRHVQVNLLSAGADEAHQELLDGGGVVGGEGGPVGGVHAQLSSPVSVL